MVELEIKAWKDADGLTAPSLLIGTQEELETILRDARQRHVFPKGYRRLAAKYVDWDDVYSTEIDLGDDVRKNVQTSDSKRIADAAATRQRTKNELAAADNFGKATRLFSDASMKRNSAIAALAGAKDRVVNTPEADKPALLKKIEIFQATCDATAKAFKTILEQYNVLRNPKATADEKNAAYIALGIIKPISQPEAPAAS